MVAVAFKLARETRKSAKSGVAPRLSAMTQEIAARFRRALGYDRFALATALQEA
jgi:hypothetical protein